MNKDIKIQQKKLLDEIKLLAQELLKIEHFAGLASLETKLYQAQKKLQILIYLEQNQLPYNAESIIPLPIQDNIIQKEVFVTSKNLENKRLSVDLNDKIAFLNQLFDKQIDHYNQAIDVLNQCENQADALTLIKKWTIAYHWQDKEEFVNRLIQTVENKFV